MCFVVRPLVGVSQYYSRTDLNIARTSLSSARLSPPFTTHRRRGGDVVKVGSAQLPLKRMPSLPPAKGTMRRPTIGRARVCFDPTQATFGPRTRTTLSLQQHQQQGRKRSLNDTITVYEKRMRQRTIWTGFSKHYSRRRLSIFTHFQRIYFFRVSSPFFEETDSRLPVANHFPRVIIDILSSCGLVHESGRTWFGLVPCPVPFCLGYHLPPLNCESGWSYIN